MTVNEKRFGLSLVVPIYRNEENLTDLITELHLLNSVIKNFEVVFVVDGSPDNCEKILKSEKNKFPFLTKIIVHSRNFGSYAAIRTGLSFTTNEISAVMSADLQEPPQLILDFYHSLQDKSVDIAVGIRASRDDGWFTDLTSKLFWASYCFLVNSEIPSGGVDIFAIKTAAKKKLLSMTEIDSSLIAQLFWLGYGRIEVPYKRRKRLIGKSGHTIKKRFEYMADSIFSFTALPIKFISIIGAFFLLTSTIYGGYIFYLALSSAIPVPGFATLILVLLTGFGLNLLCLGIIGVYVWRAFRNTQNRPQSIVKDVD